MFLKTPSPNTEPEKRFEALVVKWNHPFHESGRIEQESIGYQSRLLISSTFCHLQFNNVVHFSALVTYSSFLLKSCWLACCNPVASSTCWSWNRQWLGCMNVALCVMLYNVSCILLCFLYKLMYKIDRFIGFTSKNFKKTTAKMLTKTLGLCSMWDLVVIVKELTLSEFTIISSLLIGKLIIAKMSHHDWPHTDDAIPVAKSDVYPHPHEHFSWLRPWNMFLLLCGLAWKRYCTFNFYSCFSDVTSNWAIIWYVDDHIAQYDRFVHFLCTRLHQSYHLHFRSAAIPQAHFQGYQVLR